MRQPQSEVQAGYVRSFFLENFFIMASHTFTTGNMITTVVDLTNGIGGRTTQEILDLTKDGTIREYSETLLDGRTITYSVEVEEEVLEEEQDIEISSSKTVATCTAESSGGVVDTVRSVVEGEEMTVLRTFSRTVSTEDGTYSEVLSTEEKEGGTSMCLEFSRIDISVGTKCVHENERDNVSKTIVSENGILTTEL